MVEASTWPYVIMDYSTSNPDASPPVTLSISNKGVGPAVLPAKEAVNLMDVHVNDYSPGEYALITDEMSKLHFRVCFCSVFDECSVLDTRKEPPRPVRVKACAAVERLFQH